MPVFPALLGLVVTTGLAFSGRSSVRDGLAAPDLHLISSSYSLLPDPGLDRVRTSSASYDAPSYGDETQTIYERDAKGRIVSTTNTYTVQGNPPYKTKSLTREEFDLDGRHVMSLEFDFENGINKGPRENARTVDLYWNNQMIGKRRYITSSMDGKQVLAHETRYELDAKGRKTATVDTDLPVLSGQAKTMREEVVFADDGLIKSITNFDLTSGDARKTGFSTYERQPGLFVTKSDSLQDDFWIHSFQRFTFDKNGWTTLYEEFTTTKERPNEWTKAAVVRVAYEGGLPTRVTREDYSTQYGLTREETVARYEAKGRPTSIEAVETNDRKPAETTLRRWSFTYED